MSLTPPQTTDKRIPPTPRPRETRLFETSEALQRSLPLDRFQHFELFGETGTAAEAAASSPRVPVDYLGYLDLLQQHSQEIQD